MGQAIVLSSVRTLPPLVHGGALAKLWCGLGYRSRTDGRIHRSFFSHRILHNKTADQVFEDNDDQMSRYINDSIHNQKVYKTVLLDTGIR